MAARRIDQPTARQVRLGSILRGFREQAQSGSQETSAHALGWSEAKLNRIESGRIGISERDLIRLMDRYGVEEAALRAYVLDLRARGAVRGWESDIRSVVSAVYADYIGYEGDALEAYNAEVVLIPGLLQTHDYAAAVLDQHLVGIPEEERSERLSIRAKRQEVFKKPDPLVFWCVVSESVLRHQIGGPDVMAAQLQHLLTMSKEHPVTVNIHVLPESSPSHSALFGPFVVLAFPERWEPDIVYLEGLTGNRFLEETEEVTAYGRLFRRLMMKDSLRRPESLELIRWHLNNIGKE
ncbi:helix-turn-helix domain-containing protein [Streptomyces sp. NPDC059568]|uniref:helix-turn-helix domain-containing protein n=1 Tax=Streptomyces sp. NPDC059568 TaxID=3346868 RepID=UPI0036905B38